MNPERHRNNLELAISGDEIVLRNKVKEQYDKAFLELTADMGMKFDMATGMATVKPRIAAKAGLGGYTFKLQADSPTHLTSTIDLKPIEGSFDLAGRNYKCSHKLSARVDVALHPTPKEKLKEPIRQVSPEYGRAKEWNPTNKIDWVQIANDMVDLTVKVTIIIIGCLSLQAQMASTTSTTTSTIPFMRQMDLNDARYRAKDPGMI